MFVFFFFKQKTAYEMRISDWSSDVCSSDLALSPDDELRRLRRRLPGGGDRRPVDSQDGCQRLCLRARAAVRPQGGAAEACTGAVHLRCDAAGEAAAAQRRLHGGRRRLRQGELSRGTPFHPPRPRSEGRRGGKEGGRPWGLRG